MPDEFAQVLPTFKEIPSDIPREVNRRRQIRYSLCFPNVQFHCNCTTLFLILTLVFFFLMASLQGSILYLMCVFLKKDDYICVLFVPLSGSVGWTCLSATILDGVFPALLLVMMTH